MKVYFIYSQHTLPEHVSSFKRYFSGHNLEVLEKVFPKDASKLDFAEAEKIHKENTKKFKNADFVVAEISYVSSDLGYFISEAIQEKKPVIAFYNMSKDKENARHIRMVPVGLKGNRNKYLILKEYEPKDIEKTLSLAIADAKSLVDTKFILIIPPMIDRYLEWNVKEKGISKAEITRHAIEEMMKQDREYSNYQKAYSSSEDSSD